ncbi:tryptophan halogenase family protein [Aliiglaciecola sp. LCG003]|uniref:tryptophan halogenase family protein n=1 Tax=Aliiglaciecola sp. LCG003 TaxID=3053655 RepID=UPI002572CE2A|nr:tryptophan halogenase family protein [Aliiglaciecola sp. LCG003]WJG07902.1 tryptophan 7-halogenase [Aliiglaciecola sp. LCG003]
MNKPFKIVILGGGTAGWMAANLFANQWRQQNIQITLVESPDIGIVGVGEGSTPSLKHFFQQLNIAESDWMPRCNATYKVNIRFAGWSPASGIAQYSHPFVCQTDTFTKRDFYLNCRTRRLGLDTHVVPEDFLLNGWLAKQNKGPLAPENFPFEMEYGYHFDSHLLGQFLAEHGQKLGVIHRQEIVTSVETHDNGDIARLQCESGAHIDGDLFVDCSGFAAVLMQRTLGVKFQSYKENLFNDAAVVMPTPIKQVIPAETIATALTNGWAWKIPLTNRYGNGYVYSSDFISSDQAEQELRLHLQTLDDPQACRHLKMRVGQLEQHWVKNCIGLGLSQGFIEPLEATALHLVQVCIETFITEFESGKFTAQHQQKYNQQISERFERVRDYVVAHYKLNTRDDSEYWRVNRNNENLSDSLLNILHVWYQREDLQTEINRQQISSHFDTISWHCLLAGYGAFPPLAAKQPRQGDMYLEKSIEQFNYRCALNFSSHQSNLNQLK